MPAPFALRHDFLLKLSPGPVPGLFLGSLHLD